MTAEPADRFYESHGLRLHYVDWGNEAAPPLILVHGGLDHCRNWDAIARELLPLVHEPDDFTLLLVEMTG